MKSSLTVKYNKDGEIEKLLLEEALVTLPFILMHLLAWGLMTYLAYDVANNWSQDDWKYALYIGLFLFGSLFLITLIGVFGRSMIEFSDAGIRIYRGKKDLSFIPWGEFDQIYVTGNWGTRLFSCFMKFERKFPIEESLLKQYNRVCRVAINEEDKEKILNYIEQHKVS